MPDDGAGGAAGAGPASRRLRRPLDLLVDLAERQRLDLGRISVVALVDQFVAASAQLAAHVALERRADWLVMATRLVPLRSRSMSPASPEAADAAAREAAREVARIDALQVVRTATGWLQERPQLGQEVFARAPWARPARGFLLRSAGGLPRRSLRRGGGLHGR